MSSVITPRSSCVVLPLLLLSFFLCSCLPVFCMVLICALYRPLLCQLTTPHSQLPSKLSGFVNNQCPAQVKTLGGTMTSGRTLMGSWQAGEEQVRL